jgi:hypothetical protein
MNRVTKGAVAFAMVIPLSGCIVELAICKASQVWGSDKCSDPRQASQPPDLILYRWVDKEGRFRTTLGGHALTMVPGEYLIWLSGNAGVSSITQVFGKYGIKSIKDIIDDPQRKSFFLVTLTEEPGSYEMERLGRKNNHLFLEVTPNYAYTP